MDCLKKLKRIILKKILSGMVSVMTSVHAYQYNLQKREQGFIQRGETSAYPSCSKHDICNLQVWDVNAQILLNNNYVLPSQKGHTHTQVMG